MWEAGELSLTASGDIQHLSADSHYSSCLIVMMACLNILLLGHQRVAHHSHRHLAVKENMQGLLPVELNDPVEP